MGWLSSFFRPFHTAAQMREMRLREEESDKYTRSVENQLGELRSQVESIDAANTALTDAYKEACRERDERVGQLADAQSEITVLRTKLAEAERNMEALEEIERLVERFEDERAKYKLRIKSLKASLSEARDTIRKMAQRQADDEVTTIEFDRQPGRQGSRPASDGQNRRMTPEPEKNGSEQQPDDNDWLMPLPPI